MTWLLFACAPPPWTAAGALAPLHRRLDRDRDGVVSAVEFDAVGDAGELAAADADGNGSLDPAELAAMVMARDPGTAAGNAAVVDASATIPSAAQHRIVWLVLDALRQEVLAKDPSAVVPSDARIEAADRVPRFDTPEARALLDELEIASAKVGIPFPASLSRR